jgi:hypothetical protein
MDLSSSFSIPDRYCRYCPCAESMGLKLRDRTEENKGTDISE